MTFVIYKCVIIDINIRNSIMLGLKETFDYLDIGLHMAKC